jgi:hypothetical protein
MKTVKPLSILALSLGLAASACTPVPTLQTVPQTANITPSIQQQVSATRPVERSAFKQTETFRFIFDLRPTAFRTQAVDPSEVKFLKLTLVGDGISEVLVNDATTPDGFIAIVNGQAIATISNIPLQNGKLRIVTAQGYDANKQPLESFVSKGYYLSSENQTQVSVDLSRSRLLTGLALEKILAKNPAKASSFTESDLLALQNSVNQALGYNPLTSKFLTDPTLFDADKLADLLLNSGIPSAETLFQQTKLSPGNVTLRIKTTRGGAFGEGVFFKIQDPLSQPVSISPGTISPALANIQAAPGPWTFYMEREGGGLLLSSSTYLNSGSNFLSYEVNVKEIPIITNISNLSASIGASITISGGGFDTLLGNNTVKFGTTTAIVTAATNSSLTVTVPVGAVGQTNLTVTVAGQTSNPQTFQVLPGITGMTPNNGILGASIVLSGGGFDSIPGNNTVKFGTTPATVSAASATSLTITVPAGVSGSQNIHVTVGGLTSGNQTFEVTPNITGLSSNTGKATDSITISGTGFDGATMANNTVNFGTTAATITAATATSLTVTVPNAPGGGQNVTVQVGNQTSTASAFTMSPAIASLSASNGFISSSLTITGTGFDTTAANNTVKFGTTAATVTAATATSLTVTVPAAISGTQNVTVTVGGQTNAGTHNYAVTPSITSLSATSGVSGDSITLNGTGFDTTPANNTVKFGTTPATVTAATATSLTVTVPTAVSGAQNVTVQVGTQTSASSAFTMKPKITALTTAAGVVSGKAALIRGEALTISGTGFDLTTAGNNTVKFAGLTTTATGFSGVDLVVTVPTNIPSGDVSVTVEVNSEASAGVTATVPLVGVNLTGGLH